MNRISLLGSVLLPLIWSCSYGQMNPALLETDLRPYRIAGRQNPVQRNLSFAEYNTARLRRSFSTLLLPGTINPLNSLLTFESVPLLRKERYRSKDVYRFRLNKHDQTLFLVECRALLKVRERFRLIGQQDSSFFGALNHDLLIASIVPLADTAKKWSVVASNLNATRTEPQKGKIIRDGDEISFVLTDLLLRESGEPAVPGTHFTTVQPVYAFSYQGEIVGAVSFKAHQRKIWIDQHLQADYRDVIAATAVLLTIRRNLYRP